MCGEVAVRAAARHGRGGDEPPSCESSAGRSSSFAGARPARGLGRRRLRRRSRQAEVDRLLGRRRAARAPRTRRTPCRTPRCRRAARRACSAARGRPRRGWSGRPDRGRAARPAAVPGRPRGPASRRMRPNVTSLRRRRRRRCAVRHLALGQRPRGPTELAQARVAHALDVLVVLQHRAERRVDDVGVELLLAERDERLRPVDRLGDARRPWPGRACAAAPRRRRPRPPAARARRARARARSRSRARATGGRSSGRCSAA